MKIITNGGNLEEGIALTEEESEFVEEVTKGVRFNDAIGYISSRDRNAIALFVIKNFNLTRRLPAVEKEEE